MSKIVDYLEKLNLSEVEAKLYVTLLESGPITVRDLARKIGISRTTSYPYINLLLEKELIMKIVNGSRILVQANPPQQGLQHLIQEKFTAFQTIKNEFPDILKILTDSLPIRNELNEDRIEYYKGVNSISKIFRDLLNEQELRIYANLTDITSLLSLKPTLFSELLEANKSLKIFNIIADSPDMVKQFSLENIPQNARFVYRFMPTHKDMIASLILMYGNTLAILNMREKITCIVLYNVDYFINAKNIFDFNWERLLEILATK